MPSLSNDSGAMLSSTMTAIDNLTSSATDNNATTATAADVSECYLQPGQCEIIRIIEVVTLSLSITAVVISMVCFIILRKYRLFHQRVIFNLFVANFITATSLIGFHGRPESDGTALCLIQGFFGQLGALAEIVWFCNLTTVIFMFVVYEKDTVRYERVYMVVGWGIPLLSSCLPFIEMDYGPAHAPFCWLKSDSWRFGVYWAPVILVVIVTLGVFIYMIWHTKRAMGRYTEPCDQFTERHKYLRKHYLRPLAGYAGVFLLLNLIQIGNRIQNALEPPIFSLVAFHTFAISSYGMMLGILFVITNGRTVFTIANFRNGIHSHIKSIRSCGNQQTGTSVMYSDATTLAPVNKGLPANMDESVADSGIEEADRKGDNSNIK